MQILRQLCFWLLFRNHHNCFLQWKQFSIKLHSHQECAKDVFCPQSCQYLQSFMVLLIAILTVGFWLWLFAYLLIHWLVCVGH